MKKPKNSTYSVKKEWPNWNNKAQKRKWMKMLLWDFEKCRYAKLIGWEYIGKLYDINIISKKRPFFRIETCFSV